jgi:murein DD-endopeptidase MepM/ murein hydrolase activator NlpD
MRRTGVATAVVSTLGIAMVNTTGIAHSDAPQGASLRGSPTVAGVAGVTVEGGTDTLTDGQPPPPGEEATGTDPAAMAAEHILAHDEALAELSILLVQQRHEEVVADHERREALRWVRPIEGRITQRFGGANSHIGLDIGAVHGTPIVAAHRGTVVYSGWMSGYGRLVMIKHENNVVTAYGHMSRLDVVVGEEVATGEQIGLEGSTGHSTGPHLHFEVRLNGKDGTKVDPLAWLAGHGVLY